MQTTAATAQSIAEEGLAALRAGDWVSARTRFEDVVAMGAADANVLACLASACFRLRDYDAGHGAADPALALDSRNLRAVWVKAELLFAQGAKREANSYFNALIALSAGAARLAPDIADGVARARAAKERLTADMEEHLRAGLERAGYGEAKSNPRFTRSLGLLTGKKKLYLQQPRAFYYPELPNIQFYAPETFAWLGAVEAQSDAITEELGRLLHGDCGFAPYLHTHPNLPNRQDPLIDSLDWSACFLWKDGEATENASLCPRTMAALKGAPLCQVKGRSPQIMFSQLKPGAHILPHTGYVNTRLVCHLPLIVPPHCQFRVGNEVRSWKRGKAWVFDDTIEHEARNDSDQTRVVLIFDIWRPELSQEEQILVAALLEALDSYSGESVSWD